MSRNVFGWDLPPGCTQRHIDEAFGGNDPPCECCGHDPAECICPECPNCEQAGDPYCYEHGHHSDVPQFDVKLEYNTSQLIGQSEMKLAKLREDIAYEEQALAFLREKREKEQRAEQRNADRVDGYDRDDLGESPDF